MASSVVFTTQPPDPLESPDPASVVFTGPSYGAEPTLPGPGEVPVPGEESDDEYFQRILGVPPAGAAPTASIESPYEAPDVGAATWGDYGNVFMNTTHQIAAGVNSIGRWATNDPQQKQFFIDQENYHRNQADYYLGTMTPGGKAKVESSVLDISAAPIHAWQMLTYVGLPLFTTLATGGYSGVLFGGIIGGAMGAGDATEQMYSQLDSIPNERWPELSPAVRDFMSNGDTLEVAVNKAKDLAVGAKPAVAFLIDTVANTVTGGVLTKGAVGALGKGMLARFGLSATEGAAAGAAQGASTAELTNEAVTPLGLPPQSVAQAATEGAVAGGVLALPGGLHGGRTPPERVPVVNEAGVGAAEKAALDASKPATPAAPPPSAPAAGANADVLQQHVVDLNDAIAAARATGEDTTALETQAAQAQAALDAAKAAPTPAAPAPPVAAEAVAPVEGAGTPPVAENAPVAAPVAGEAPVAAPIDGPQAGPSIRPSVESIPPAGAEPPPTDASAPAAPPTAAAPAGGIPFVITQAMKAKLREVGFTADQIKQMTPEQAHALINSVHGPAEEALKREAAPARAPVIHEEAPSPLVKEKIATGEKAAKALATRDRRKAAAAERAAKVEAGAAGPEARAPSHKGTAAQLERSAREERVKNVFEAQVTKGKEWPDRLPETVPEMEALYKRVMTARQEILKAGVPPRRIRDAATDHDAWARETLDLASTMDKGNRDRVRTHIEDYLGRLGPAKEGDFKPMRAERRSAAAQKVLDRVNKGAGGKDVDTSLEGLAAGPSGAATEALPAKSVGEAGGTPTTKFEKAPAGKSRVVKGKEAEAIAKRLGLPLAKATKKAAGEAGTTTGKTEPVTSQVTKSVGPKGVEVLAKRPKRVKKPVEAKKAEPPPPPKETTRSHAAHDDAIEKTAAHAAELVERLQGLKNLRAEEKNGKRKADIGKQVKDTIAELATVRAHHDALVGSAELKDAMAGREAEGTDRPTPEEARKAYDARRHWAQRVEDLSGDPARKDDLATAQAKLAEAEDVLRRAADLEDNSFISNVERRGGPGERIAGALNHPLSRVMRAAAMEQRSHGSVRAVTEHTHVFPNHQTLTFRSAVDTTVGALMDGANASALASRIYNLGGYEARRIIERIITLAKDTPVNAVSFKDVLPNQGKAAAIHVRGLDGANRILINLDNVDVGNNQLTHMDIIHEALHEITIGAYNQVPRFKYIVDELYNHTKQRIGEEEFAGMYGAKNAYEFIAEAMSNPEFHALLSDIEAPAHIIDALGLDKVATRPTLWTAFVEAIRRLKEFTGLSGDPQAQHSVISALARAIGEVTDEGYTRTRNERTLDVSDISAKIRDRVRDSGDWIKRAAEHALDRPSPDDQHGVPWNLKFVDGNYIARQGDRFFGEKDNPVRAIVNGWQRTHTDSKLELAKAMPLIQRMINAERTHGAERFGDLIDVAHDATNSGVHPDKPLTDKANAHTGKNSLSGAQARYRHPDIARRYNALPTELKTVYRDMVKFFSEQQNKLNLQTIRNQLLEVAGIKLDAKGEALANRIFLNKMTEADVERLGDLAEPLRNTNILGKLDGPYVPLIRRGDYVVTATAKIPAPDPSTGFVQIKDENGKPMSVYEFGAGAKANKTQARRDAMAYAEKLKAHAEPRSVWVDEKTGNLYHEGEEPPVKVLKNDPNADQRFRVYVQDQHTEFVDNRKVAERRRNELVASGQFHQVDRVAHREQHNFPQSGWLASQMRTLESSLEKRPGFKDLPGASQANLKQVLREASARLYSSTRIETRGIPRRHVAGHGREIINDITDYARASSGRLAQLRHAPAINAALTRMNRLAGDDHPQKFGRSAIANEINKRAVANNGYQEGGKFTRAVQRMMGLQFTTHLATPSHTIVNLTQHPLLTTTTLAARHGWLRTVSQTRKAFRDVGYFKQLGKGIADTGRAFAGKDTHYDYITNIRNHLPANERELFDKAVMEGALDPDAGLEVAQAVDRLNASTPLGELANKADAMLAWSQAVAHHLPRAAEVLNRAPALLAAYRLERATKGASHAEAMQYAIDTVHKTQFNYSPVNRAPAFNHPLARLLLQFKQYPQHLMQLVGENIGKVIRKEINPGDRAEAVKALVNVVGANVLMAGTLGLPTEIFKVVLTAAGPILGAVGIKVPTWNEVEDQEQRLLIGMFGQTAGVGLSRGIPAMLGVDMNPNLGWQNMFTFGAPDSYGAKDMASWTIDQVGGTPYALLKDYLTGFEHLAAGEYAQAAENYIPFKFATNLSKAWRETMYGKVNKAGRTTFDPYSVFEAGVRAVGFKPTRESLAGERAGAFLRSQRDYSSQRTQLLNDFYNASPSDRMRMMGQVNEWNRGRPADEQLTFTALQDYVRQRGKEKVLSGFPVRSPRDERTMRQLEGYYGNN